jgi:hypothetical protein
MAIDVFLSVGRTVTPQQETFVREIETFFVKNGLAPRTVGRTSFSSEQPLRHVSTLMDQCSGTVIVAFERTFIGNGLDRRGSANPQPLADVKLPTVWNQIEAAMGYAHFHPLLVIVEHGVKSEGLLETGYDWYVQWVDLDLSALRTDEFQGVFADWKQRVEKRFAAKASSQKVTPVQSDIQDLTLGQMFRALTVKQLWAAIIALATALATIATVAFNLGRLAAAGSG